MKLSKPQIARLQEVTECRIVYFKSAMGMGSTYNLRDASRITYKTVFPATMNKLFSLGLIKLPSRTDQDRTVRATDLGRAVLQENLK